MSNLNERVSYLQGLLEGLDISDATKEGKAIEVIAEILEEIAYAISDVVETQEDIQDYISCIDEDLADLEEKVYTDRFVEVYCPDCGEVIEVDPSIVADPSIEIICPECGEAFTPEALDWELCYCDFDEDDWDDDNDDDGDDDDWDDEEVDDRG